MVDENGQSFVDDIRAGDVLFFSAGVPRSIQALEESCEFLWSLTMADSLKEVSS
jgi:oxalate decarboxylase